MEEGMNVETILEAKGRSVATIPPDAQVAFAAHKLSAMGIGALVVSPDGARVEGVVSERDLVRGLTRHGARLLELQVADVMSKGGPVCSPGDTIKKVMSDMTRTRNRHVVVLEGNRLYGVVSIGDIVKHRLEELELETNVLRDAYRVSR
jgi:CBS domain-containing protein